MSKNWSDLRKELNLTAEEEALISMEKELISTLIEIREEEGITQAELAEKCHVKQSAIARLESGVHSPQINSMLKILVPLGYTLKVTPIKKK